MTLFHSIVQRYEQEEPQPSGLIYPWPAVFRDKIPTVDTEHFALQIGIEKQLARSMTVKQLMALPCFNENRRITSKAGWTYYGQWKGVTFQTLFSLFSTPQLYPWVRIETLTGDYALIERAALSNYRLVSEGDGKLLPPLYGGPLWVHCFDHYLEYNLPYVHKIVLMQGDYKPHHPAEALGFAMDQARVQPGQYYAIHHEKLASL